jgi:hypothetical protein
MPTLYGPSGLTTLSLFMPQDFAKQRNAVNGKKPSPRKTCRAATRVQSSSDGHWSWFLTGLMAGLFAAFILYLGFVRPSETSATTSAVAADTQIAPGTSRGDFGFYEYLPSAEVQVDVVQVEERATPAEDTTNFLLQAGSFQDRQDAESRRVAVLLLNFEASVVPGVVGGKTWHRVQVGPFVGRQAADDARNALSESNIDTLVLVLR